MNVFLSRLTANQIGFTAFGLFTIDKPTIIAVSIILIIECHDILSLSLLVRLNKDKNHFSLAQYLTGTSSNIP